MRESRRDYKGLTFLFRNPRGEVEWAYPVTVADTPHRYTLDGGAVMTPA